MRGTVSGTTQVTETETMAEDWVLGGLLVGVLGTHSWSEARPCLLPNVELTKGVTAKYIGGTPLGSRCDQTRDRLCTLQCT